MRNALAQEVAKVLRHPQITAEVIAGEFSTPPDPAMGHLALPCFGLSKLLGKPSDEVAKLIAAGFASLELRVSASGPYANFRWNTPHLYREIIARIFERGDRYGEDDSGENRVVVIEYCSPNIAQPLLFQHIRSTLIGNTLANLYRCLGYRVERICFVGDWGSPFGRLLAGLELWGDREMLARGIPTPPAAPTAMDPFFEIYARFQRALAADPSYGDRASRCLQQLEEREPKVTALWGQIRQVSLSTFEATLKRMDIQFDHIEGESTYVPGVSALLEAIKQRAEARLSEGAWIVDVEGALTPALIQKKDGTTLYLTRDIAAAIDRHQRFDPYKMFYVVSEQQRLHFQLLFGVLKKMGCSWAERCEHIGFGTALMGSETLANREGKVSSLDDLLNEAKARALVECTRKNPELVGRDQIAERVGTGAVMFACLSGQRPHNLEMDWDGILALDGETGPYVQYAAVRCRSLLEKAAAKGETLLRTVTLPERDLATEEELLLVALGRFGLTLHRCVQDNDPYHLTRYLIDLAKAFNRFYIQFPVLQAGDAVQRRQRLNLVEATRQTLINGLRILGIHCPSEM
jgi:arginyl-tRNA synthetase